jgi:integrase
LKRQRTLALIEQYPKVKQFLNSKSRNSQRTKYIYGFGLSHFQTFLNNEYNDYNIETVLAAIEEKKINVYSLLDNFVTYLIQRQDNNTKLSSQSMHVYVVSVRSYLEYWDIDIVPSKFKKRVTIPKIPKRIKQPLDAKDIRTILQACTNTRLKVFLLVLASSGMRSKEALTLRNSDIDFSSNPTGVHIRAENSKTKQANDIYISNEASKELKMFIDSKYNGVDEFKKYPEHLIFSFENSTDSKIYLDMYRAIHLHFTRTLKKIEMDKRKDGKGIQRRDISFHLFRTFVYTTVTNTANTSFAQWLCSKTKSEYWESKEAVRRELYIKCMEYLTFLDYPLLEARAKNTEERLKQQDKEVSELRKELSRYKRAEEINEQTFNEMKSELSKKQSELSKKGEFMLQEVKDIRAEFDRISKNIDRLKKKK